MTIVCDKYVALRSNKVVINLFSDRNFGCCKKYKKSLVFVTIIIISDLEPL